MDKKDDYFFLAVFLFLSALIAPLLLINAEKTFPYPHIIEEIAKVIFVLFILRVPEKKFQIQVAVFIGFLFAFSENFFYLPSFIEDGNLVLFLQRFVLTSLLHILTILIILVPSQKKRFLILPAAALAMTVHYFYNQFIVLLIR